MLGYREALELFRYDYETGVLYWRWSVNNSVPKHWKPERKGTLMDIYMLKYMEGLTRYTAS